LLSIPIPLPPLDEQRRIVARIQALAAKIEEALALRQQAAEETEGLVASTATHLLAGIRFGGRLEDVLLGRPRNGWSVRCDNSENGTPVLSLGAITGFRYRPAQYKKTSHPAQVSAHYWLRQGDLLISRSNTPDLVGHAAIYNGSPSPCIYPDLMMRLAVDEQGTSKAFVHWLLRSSPTREYIRRVAKGTSPTMKKISQQDVMNIPFPTGISIREQTSIVAYLDGLQAKVDALKRLQAETAAQLDALLPSILDRAFKGQL
jgi:type I restriction enzyme S subunit